MTAPPARTLVAMNAARPLVLIAVALSGLWGCAAKGPADVEIASGRYAAAFEAAKSALVRSRFELDRVDARSGVITTRPKGTAGLATPWDVEQSSLRQEFEDLANEQTRRVRVTFTPPGGDPVGPAEDLRAAEGPLVARVEVSVDRVRHTGLVLDPTAVRLSRAAQSQSMTERGLFPRYSVPFSRDDEWARRVADRIREQMPAGTP